MKINIVTEKGDWILPRWSREWAKRLPATITHEPKDGMDVNLYVNYGYFNKPMKSLDVCYFTHREFEDPMRSLFDRVASECDYCVCQSQVTMDKIDRKEKCIIRPGINEAYYLDRKVVVGVVGRDYAYTNRKRFHWIPRLAKRFNDIVFSHISDLSEESMPEAYDGMDYLLITASNEGGPMPVVEALARGVPVIAPVGVGWCDEFSLIRYDSTYKGLVDTLQKLTFPRDQWEVSTERLNNLFKRVLNEK